MNYWGFRVEAQYNQNIIELKPREWNQFQLRLDFIDQTF